MTSQANASADAAVDAPARERQLAGLALIVELSRIARQASDVARLGFVMVNETHRLCAYRHAVFLAGPTLRKLRLTTVSGVPEPDRHAPMGVWLQRALAASRPTDARVQRWDPDDLPESIGSAWQQWLPAQVLMMRLDGPGGLAGVVLYARNEPWTDAESVMLGELGGAYAHALAALNPRRVWTWSRIVRNVIFSIVAAAAVASAVLVRVNLSALGEAEVVAADAVLVRAPMDGVVERLDVSPNRRVKAGEPLLQLDAAELRNKTLLSAHAVTVATAEYRQAAQQALIDPRSKSRVALLKVRLEQSQAEHQHFENLLARTAVLAPADGIAVFADASDWPGKAVRLGERIMQIADPAEVELQISLPVADAVNLKSGAPVRMFLNIAPEDPLPATLTYASYRAEPAENGVLAYTLKARFDAQVAPLPRIGLKGTARVEGDEVSLGYFLFRRPLATARRWLGL